MSRSFNNSCTKFEQNLRNGTMVARWFNSTIRPEFGCSPRVYVGSSDVSVMNETVLRADSLK